MPAWALFFFLLSLGSSLLATEPARVPVLLELFTSEGCSSCPPADKLLAALDHDQPISGVEIIPLAWHVDYWDRLGWKDRFSKPSYTQRQYDYRALKHWVQVYTPQALIQGGTRCNGADWPAIQAQVQALSPSSARRLELSLTRTAKGLLRLRVKGASEGLPLQAALSEDGLESSVTGGENEGTVLRHQAVVRGWWPSLSPEERRDGIKLDPKDLGLEGGPLRAVAWQPAPDGRILAVGQSPRLPKL